MTIEAPPAPIEGLPATPPPAPAAIAPAEFTPPTPAAPVEVPPATPPPAPVIGPKGELGENWFLTLGDQFAPSAADLGKYKDLGALVAQYQYFQKNGVEYPVEGSQPTVVDRFRKVAGVPETPEGYGLTAESMKLPEGMSFDAELADVITKAAHKTHTPPAALAAIVSEFNTVLAKRTADAAAEAQKAQQAAQDELVKEWRGDFVTNSSTARHIASLLGETARLPIDSPEVTALANTPAFAKMMLAVSHLISDDRIATPAGFGDLRSPADRVKAITSGADPVWGAKYVSGTDAEKREAYDYVTQLRARMAQ